MNKRSSANQAKKTIKPDIHSKPWYKNIMALLTIFTAVIAAGTGAFALIQQLTPAKVAENTIIVFDRSSAMNDPFEEGTKLQAAIKAVDDVFAGEAVDADNLALRSFGGPCVGENSKLEIGFRKKNTQRVKDLVKTFSPKGDTTLVSAMIEALGDFNDPKRFEGVHKRIILITGGASSEGNNAGKADSCFDDPVTYIRSRLDSLYRGEDISVSFRFIGMALNTEEKRLLTAIAQETGGIAKEDTEDQLFFVESTEELERALTQIVDIEPILTAANGMGDIMNNVTDYVSNAIRAINDEDYPLAQQGLHDAKNEFNNTELLLEDYKQRLNVPEFYDEFQQLYELLQANRALQEKQLELLEIMIDQGARGDSDAQQDTISDWNQKISEFNRNIREMDKITSEIWQRLLAQR